VIDGSRIKASTLLMYGIGHGQLSCSGLWQVAADRSRDPSLRIWEFALSLKVPEGSGRTVYAPGRSPSSRIAAIS
jgi:hypothetical protein